MKRNVLTKAHDVGSFDPVKVPDVDIPPERAQNILLVDRVTGGFDDSQSGTFTKCQLGEWSMIVIQARLALQLDITMEIRLVEIPGVVALITVGERGVRCRGRVRC